MNNTKKEGQFDEVLGKFQKNWGDLIGSSSDRIDGSVKEIKGKAKQTFASVQIKAAEVASMILKKVNNKLK